MKNRSFYIFLFSVFLINSAVFSQTRKELEFQRIKYKTVIAQLNTLLFNEKEKEKNALDDLRDLQLKIDARNKLIETINLETKLLSREIVANQKEINKLDKKLTDLKTDYGDMIFKSYKSKSQQSRMMFILSSQNFYQAYKRLEYMKQYTAFRKKQGEEIIVQTTIIKGLKDSLLGQKKIKDALLLSEINEKKEIEKDKSRQEGLINEIKRKEGKYKRELQNNIKEDKKIAAKIDKIIKDEIDKANRLALAKAKKNNVAAPVTTKKNEFILTPEAKALAAEFEQNKGKLPWPVRQGLVVRRFGEQPHPTFPGISINGTGLHIVTSKASSAEAIFNGEVLNILLGSGGTKNVLIRHGNYITSYNNLENTFVKKGDRVVTGQEIGKIFTDKVTGKTTLIFVLFKNTTRLNPASWMLRR
ncbi:Septal ring factor EnvC, activator of murein hydrolases AmiA and AmiB [Polaribacter sp. KT25b]|uniref:murein hydrolase activator EnvC family protein n=1 Tax=Polaribacter sp. KT25b TaxID=1855336 RepID=UPI00087D332F|nr:peptidoglycan DD-metalloendopeptidase family protein [Polaribacter sp. KT25b]SDS38340.1 Septal ring factor EnvC, activator of murein hydrolases AmiA and AmiB [Polaribacter sp. KT25b]